MIRIALGIWFGLTLGLATGLPLAWEIDRQLQPEPEWIEIPPVPQSELQRAPAGAWL